jgi:hypothetical protein
MATSIVSQVVLVSPPALSGVKVSVVEDIAQTVGRIDAQLADVFDQARGVNMVGEDIALRVGNLQTNEVQAIAINSATLKAIDNAMPGFADRGAKGADSLKDLGTSGRDHSPLANAVLSNFAGGGSGLYSVAPPQPAIYLGTDKNGTSTYENNDGSTTWEYKDGSSMTVTVEGTIITRNADGSSSVDNGSWTDYYDTNGAYAGTSYIVDGNTYHNFDTGTTKEPINDATPSGRPVITAETLRGLAARLGAAGEPTGDEATSGGPVDESKTRQGQIGQVGEPVPDSPAARTTPTSLEIDQALRVRLRNVTPIPK